MSTTFPSVNEQMDLIRRGAVEIIPEEELVKKLELSLHHKKPLRIKLGCDPSRPDLHIGHSVVLRKLRHFQMLGHQAVLIIGDFTGMIGDPTGRNSARPPLTLEDTREFGKSYFEQASKILDAETTEIVYNSQWLAKMSFEDVIKLASKYTVARMLERDDFTKRYKGGVPISIHEFLYPLAQGMDSVAISSDVELGGNDQKFNLLVGRDLQREFGMEPQVILTMPLLVGTDGVEKMSKSYGNYIGINEEPKEIFGKTLSIADSMIYTYFELASDVPKDELESIRAELANPATNPRNLKRYLGKTLVRMYHSQAAADAAQDEFDKIFIKKEIPDELPELAIAAMTEEQPLADLLAEWQQVPSKSEARRLIQQGGVTVNGEKVADVHAKYAFTAETIIKMGKRKFLKLTIQ